MDERVVELARRSGYGQHRLRCPMCSGERKTAKGRADRPFSLNVDDERAVYHCHHCNADGAVSLREKRSENSRPAVQRAPIKIDKAPLQSRELSHDALAWLHQRGISSAVAAKAGLQCVQHFIRDIGTKTECVGFPYPEGVFKLRSISDKGFSSHGAASTLFLLDQVDPNADRIIITEGEMDALALCEAGVANAVSLPNGALNKAKSEDADPAEDRKIGCIWTARDKLALIPKIIIATDGDHSGEITADEIARRIGKHKCWRVRWPEGSKDANDVLLNHGCIYLADLINRAEAYPIAGLYDADHFSDKLEDLYNNGFTRGISTGYDDVDSLFTVVPGHLTVVTGIPGSGKSEFVDQLMINIARNNNWKFAVCSFENPPEVQIANLMAKRENKPFFPGRSDRMTPPEFKRAQRWINERFCFLFDGSGEMVSMDSILERLLAAVGRYGIRGAVIDPYNYIARPRSSEFSETDWISSILTRLVVFCRTHGVHIWFVAHPTKLQKNMEGKYNAPGGYEISGSAAWFAKADIGLTVHRPDKLSTDAEIVTWKVRFRQVGKVGSVTLLFDTVTGTYSALERERTIPGSYVNAGWDVD